MRHIGIYAYRSGFIKQYVQWQPLLLEQIEKLEQLRVCLTWRKNSVELAHEVPQVGVDTADDLEKVRLILGHYL